MTSSKKFLIRCLYNAIKFLYHEPYYILTSTKRFTGSLPSTNRRLVHQAICRRLSPQCQCSLSIHDNTHPEDLHKAKENREICMCEYARPCIYIIYKQRERSRERERTWTAFNGTEPEETSATTLIINAATPTVRWNWINFLIFAYTDRPHLIT